MPQSSPQSPPAENTPAENTPVGIAPVEDSSSRSWAGPSPREISERIELQTLSRWALPSASSKGRDAHEPEDELRTCFQRDRDRIVHSKAFRRLGHKTQVFLAPEGDHYRVRLTHTLEVAQVARTIARALRLNEDLVEAICLGHDLGHTPFGHLGEEVVAAWHPGFKHNLQSVRIVEVIEELNLTWEVRDGIANHTWSMPMPGTLEGQVTRFADRIAYINHDIDDAVRAGILQESDLPGSTLRILGTTHARRIRTMVEDLVAASRDAGQISMSSAVTEAMAETRSFLFDRVYLGRVAAGTREGVGVIVRTLLEHYAAEASVEGDSARSRSVDYVAGMTDRFALRAYEELVGSTPPSLDVLDWRPSPST